MCVYHHYYYMCHMYNSVPVCVCVRVLCTCSGQEHAIGYLTMNSYYRFIYTSAHAYECVSQHEDMFMHLKDV